LAFHRIHSEYSANSLAFRGAFLSGARPERAQRTVGVLRVLGADRGRAGAFRHIHAAFPAISVAVRSSFLNKAGPGSTQRTDPILTAPGAERDREMAFRRIHTLFFAFAAAAPRHFRGISERWRPPEHPMGQNLRILSNSHRIRREAPIKQLAQQGICNSKGAREARHHAGLRHNPRGRLTLNQRVQGSSPWGLTILHLVAGTSLTTTSCIVF
jgi:hypothetical protein